MESMQFFRKMFDYDYWGNREALASLSGISGDATRARRFFNHIIGAQRIWLSRFETPDPPAAEAWPLLTHEEASAAVEELRGRWGAILDGMTPEKLSGDLMYRNTKGLEFKTPIQDVLMHLVMHSAYHRGQVAAAVRDSAGNPAVTDYVVYVRKLKS
jgi:uncharacterized damage-inducible protein DinB